MLRALAMSTILSRNTSQTNQGKHYTNTSNSFPFPKCSAFVLLLLLSILGTSYGYTRHDQETSSVDTAIHFRDDSDEDDERVSLVKRKRQLCPGSDSSKLSEYYFHEGSQQCYLSGTKGPCAMDMKFGPIHDSPAELHGECYCEESKGPNDTGRPVIYDPFTDRCFPVYTQGPCAPGNWVAFDPDTGKYQCQLNPCLAITFYSDSTEDAGGGSKYGYYRRGGRREGNEESQSELVLFNDRCIPLGTRAAECASSEVVRFAVGINLPVCAPKDIEVDLASYAFGALGRKNCKVGSSRSRFSRKCIKNFMW